MEVGRVFVSTSEDPTNDAAIVGNITDFEQSSPELGRVRLNFRVDFVCESCTLHVLSLIPNSRRLRRLSSQLGRVLQEDQTGTDFSISSEPVAFLASPQERKPVFLEPAASPIVSNEPSVVPIGEVQVPNEVVTQVNSANVKFRRAGLWIALTGFMLAL